MTKMKSSHVRGDYVFKEVDGNLEFVGDFNGLYKNDSDPWDQSATTDQEITCYYKSSRKRLIEQLNVISPTSILEIGCGLGYTTKTLQDAFPKIDVTGMDISDVAIEKARKLFPDLSFICADIRDVLPFEKMESTYDVVILNQLLWYILKQLPSSFENCQSILKAGGKIAISQAFPKTKLRYGTEICDGFESFIKHLNKNFKNFKINYLNLDASKEFIHDDAIIMLSTA
tara:strand:- start:4582 stop:5268 length:687 start_codon:yes stop_codon:yes gene_type:complete